MKLVDLSPADEEMRWHVRLTREEASNVDWDWSWGEPPVREMLPVRRPKSRALSKHVPVLAYSLTTRSVHHLESDVEMELLLLSDRDPMVAWIVAQPIMVRFSAKSSHVLDLLTVDVEGRVTAWDVRPRNKQDSDFECKSRKSRDAFQSVGWNYRVHSGLSENARLNLRWIACARRPPEWLESTKHSLFEFLSHERTIGEVIGADHDGFMTSTFWHLVWNGTIALDLNAHWTKDTPIELGSAS